MGNLAVDWVCSCVRLSFGLVTNASNFEDKTTRVAGPELVEVSGHLGRTDIRCLLPNE